MKTQSLTASGMRKLDRFNIEEHGTPSILLMERAGREAASGVLTAINRSGIDSRKVKTAVFCGRGNNGGDGLVCARYLLSCNIKTDIYLLADKDSLNNDPAANALALDKKGITISEVATKASLNILKNRFNADIIIDALFGTGFKGAPKSFYSEAIEFINRQKSYIISVDVPSGMDATTGIAASSAVIADETITFGFAKTGFYTKDGPVCCGRVKVVDIGLRKA